MVRTAAKRVGINHPRYAIVGDDIVIVGKLVADEYRKILTELDVPFSPQKTIQGNCIEFCKRIWSGSHEITPLPAKLILESLRDYRAVLSLEDWLRTRGASEDLLSTLISRIVDTYKGTKNERLRLGLTAPFRGPDAGAYLREETR